MERHRVLIVSALILLPLGGLEARLAWLQVCHPGPRIDVNRSLDLAPAARGRILDRNGKVLALDEWAFDLHLVLEEFDRRPEARAELRTLLGLDDAAMEEAFEKIYRRIERLMTLRPERERPKVYARERRSPYVLVKAISREAAYAIETNPERFPGCVVREGHRRTYPFGTSAAHVLGFLSRASATEKEFERLLESGYFSEGFEDLIGVDDVEMLARRGVFHETMVGAKGVEKQHDDHLRGHPGLLVLERDPGTGRKVWTELVPPRPGQDLSLAIDIDIQREVELILQDARGEDGSTVAATAMVADPATGEILAMGSNATFDPNHFIPPARKEVVDAYLKDEARKPLLNRAISERYQLGSIFKIVTATAGLEESKVAPDTVFTCNGQYRPGSKTTNCWIWNLHQGMHGEVNLLSALEQSCNCYFYAVSERLSLGELSSCARKYGFGEKTGIDLPGEIRGTLPDPERRSRWLPGDGYSLAIGQHELSVTPAQVLKMICAVANGGRAVTPHVRADLEANLASLGFKPATMNSIRKGLHSVVHGERGTARATELNTVDASGKTGSAQIAGRRLESGRWPSHAWFAGYAPSVAPRFAIVVLLEKGGGGGHAAAPLAARIATRLMKSPEAK
jgi:penicillin-binding protein 2